MNKADGVVEGDTKSEKLKIPNIVHYLWYKDITTDLEYHQMLSILSAKRLLKADRILFHTNNKPNGPNWDRVKDLVQLIHKNPTRTLFGKPVKKPKYETSDSNLARVEVVYKYGGIYADLDVWFIRPMTELRQHDCVLGLESPYKVCSGTFLCTKDSPFLKLWLQSYVEDYRVNTWAYNSGVIPYRLAMTHSHMVCLDENRLQKPNSWETHKFLSSKRFDWHSKFSIHLVPRRWWKNDIFHFTKRRFLAYSFG